MTDDTPLPAGSVGMAVAGPTIDPPAGLAVSFDDFPIETSRSWTFRPAGALASIARGVAQPGSAPALGAGGRRFESARPDNQSPR